MKILYLGKDEAKIKVETTDDLWHLARIIEPKDVVAGQIIRKVKIGEESERTRVKREIYFVKILAEKVFFEPGQVKISGTIVEGPEELPYGSYHTLDVKAGDVVKIYKKWRDFQIKRLKDAEKITEIKPVAICVLDDENGILAEFGSVGIKYLANFPLGLAKKRFQEKIEERMGKLVAAVINILNNYDVLIIASPIFWKDELFKRIKEKVPELIKKIKLEDISTGGKRGVLELVKRGALDKVIKGAALQKEFELVESLLVGLAKEGLVAYNFENVKHAAEAGAIKILLVTEKFLEAAKEKGFYEELSKIFDLVENTRGEIHIINSKYEAGEKLDGIGGIGAILRFKI
ncbi:MAG: mRNA surveillance protein pelota [Candidatus Nanoarchaeia archaeon]